MSKLIISSSAKKSLNYQISRFIFSCSLLMLCTSISISAQVVQIKAFNAELEPYPSLNISINKGEFIKLDESGIAYTKLEPKDLPISSIGLQKKQLETASWNLSKGVLEIIIRQKSYIDQIITVKTVEGQLVTNETIRFKGQKSVERPVNALGQVTIPLGLNEKNLRPEQFLINGYKSVRINNNDFTLFVSIAPKDSKKIQNTPSEVTSKINQLPNWDEMVNNQINQIDSLPAFYDFIKKIPTNELNYLSKQKLDQKFKELFDSAFADSNDNQGSLGKITDSTKVENDIDNLLKKVQADRQRIPKQRLEFEQKIAVVRKKLNDDFDQLSKESKEALLADIEGLEELIKSNKEAFNENADTYIQIIAELKKRFFNLRELENRLSQSEEERLKERKIYQQRLLLTLGLVLVFAILIVLLFYLRSRLKRQKSELLVANKIVKNTNENLEEIVNERTYLLQKTFKELDTVLYKASHDLRAPLCSLSGLSNLLIRDNPNEEVSYLIGKTNDQMDKLLKKLSVISEIHQASIYEEIDLKSLSEDVLGYFQPKIEETDVLFKYDVKQQTKVVSIPKLLEFIIFQLLENAFHFGSLSKDSVTKVSFEVHSDHEEIVIKVKDEGIGIQKAHLDKIFDMFYVGSVESNGNGLGLYIVQKSVDLLRGKIEVNSKVERFTEFIISLPATEKPSTTLRFLTNLNKKA